MKSLFLIFRISCLIILLTSCNSKGTKSITVLSYNIHHGEGEDNILDLERIAGVINSVSPDIVAIQEVDMNTERTGNVNQMEVLGKLTKMDFVFGKSIDLQGGEYGNAILTKFPVKSYRIHPLPGKELRSGLAAILDMGKDQEMVFISTHFALSEDTRLKSVEILKKVLEEYKDLPLVLAGDLNALPESKVISQLEKIMDNVTVDLHTVPVDAPKRQIDYILIDTKDKWSVESSMVLDEKKASDHRPVMSVLKLK